MKRALAVVLTALALDGCAARRTASVAPPGYGMAADRSYIDLEPGWRLRVVTPLLKSGGYRAKFVEQQTSAGGGGSLNVQLASDSGFLGYELAYYTLGPNARVRLRSVEATVDGKTEARQKPVARLFEWPKVARFVRLVFLTRSSAADHDMAVLTARQQADLDAWTAKLQADPEGACRETRYCSWVPGGIAVRAERLDAQTSAWVPADGSGRPAR